MNILVTKLVSQKNVPLADVLTLDERRPQINWFLLHESSGIELIIRIIVHTCDCSNVTETPKLTSNIK